MFLARMVPRAAFRRTPTRLQMPSLVRFYANSPVPKRPIRRQEETTKFRYLIYVAIFSTAVLVFVSKKVDKKNPKKSFSPREYAEYEEITGLKRRNKLISHEKNDQYKFYALPYVHDDATVEKVAKKLPRDKEVKIIDPVELIEREIEDETRRYSYLLQDLRTERKALPSGLVTALIKEEISMFLNTTKGTYDTSFLLKNYPQTTEEAIKFENDVSAVLKCLVLLNDIEKDMPAEKGPEKARQIANVIGYFDTVSNIKSIPETAAQMDETWQADAFEDL